MDHKQGSDRNRMMMFSLECFIDPDSFVRGDTDIFPYPIENALFFDLPDKLKSLLEDMDNNFEQWLSNYPGDSIKTCIPVGFTFNEKDYLDYGGRRDAMPGVSLAMRTVSRHAWRLCIRHRQRIVTKREQQIRNTEKNLSSII